MQFNCSIFDVHVAGKSEIVKFTQKTENKLTCSRRNVQNFCTFVYLVLKDFVFPIMAVLFYVVWPVQVLVTLREYRDCFTPMITSDEHLSFSDQISALYKSCYHHIRALRCIRPYLDLHTTKTVATSIVHFTPILKSLHWLIVSERIEYKIISLTYKILNTTQPSYLYDLVSIRPPHGHNTRSSSLCHSHQTIIIIQSHSSILHLVFGTSFLHHSEFLIQITYPPLSDLHLNMPV